MTGSVTAAQLKAIAGPAARSDLVSAIVRGWPAAVAKAKLTTRLRAAHFLAQIMTETGGLRILEESGAYKAPRIMAIFGVGKHSAKITDAEAKRIAALPVAQRGPVLFNRVYGVGNPTKMREFSNTGPNDGWLYRGGGMMQATGKSNYAAMEKKNGLPLVAHPEMLHQPDSAFMAAYLEWAQDGRCNAAADRDDVVAVRKIINGGSNGLAECRAFLAKAKKALADYSVEPVVAMFAEPPEIEPEPDAPEAPALAAWTPPAAVDPDVTGDPDLYSAQKRLKGRNYSPGLLDGKWGGATSGAISAFRNDSSLDFPLPQTLAEFHDIKDELAAELLRWEDAERYRPVTPERKAGDRRRRGAGGGAGEAQLPRRSLGGCPVVPDGDLGLAERQHQLGVGLFHRPQGQPSGRYRLAAIGMGVGLRPAAGGLGYRDRRPVPVHRAELKEQRQQNHRVRFNWSAAMTYIRLACGALGATGLLTKLLVAAGLLTALLAAYGVWHHKVYGKGYDAALAAVARADARAVGKATEYRNIFKNCRAQGRGWDQTTGKCS
jgi:predicted chitinase